MITDAVVSAVQAMANLTAAMSGNGDVALPAATTSNSATTEAASGEALRSKLTSEQQRVNSIAE
jgi:hypothetical protein